MPNYRTHLQDHHTIEQQTLKNSPLLAKLQSAGKFDIHSLENRLFLPADPQFANVLGVTPHSGGPLSAYQLGMLDRLNRIQMTSDGQASLEGDLSAMDRVARRVEQLRDTVKVGLINGDLNTNTPVGSSPELTNQQVRHFFRNIPAYYQTHAQQIEALKGLHGVDHGWGAIVHTEPRIVTSLHQFQLDSRPIMRGGNIELQRSGLSLAIANAHHDGRLSISPGGILVVERTLGEEAAYRIRVPRAQQGFASMDLLLGEASASPLIRAGGLLASGADAVMTTRRVSELLQQGNGTAAQSEFNHALARSGGGWMGGLATASVIGTSSFVPAAVVAADALFMSKAFDKGADLLDNRVVYCQEDSAHVQWEFNGRNWQREAKMARAADGSPDPAVHSVGASYETARELGAKASVRAVELALGKAPEPQNPFSIPAGPQDVKGLDNQNWQRDPQTEQWTRQVKAAVVGANDRGVYETQIATPERAAELNQQAVQRIEDNIAHGKAAIAASYLETRAATRASDFVPLVPDAVETARARSDAILGSDNTLYQRDATGQWSHDGKMAQGNIALELELTRTIQQPSLERFERTVAALEARPAPTNAELNQYEQRHAYASAGVAPTPVWQQAIALATARTREQHGITGATMQELGPPVDGHAGESRPITHYQVGQDGVARPVAVTTSEELQAAWREVRARAREQAPVPEAPELRIAALSPREQEAYQQALQEANRQGAASVDAGQAALAAAEHVSGSATAPSNAREAVEAAQREEALRRPLAPAEPVAAAPQLVMRPPPEPKPEAAVARQPAEPDTPSSSGRFEPEHRRDTPATEVPNAPSPAATDMPAVTHGAVMHNAAKPEPIPFPEAVPVSRQVSASPRVTESAQQTGPAADEPFAHVTPPKAQPSATPPQESTSQQVERRHEVHPTTESLPSPATHHASIERPTADHAEKLPDNEKSPMQVPVAPVTTWTEPTPAPITHPAYAVASDADPVQVPRDEKADPTHPGHPDHALYQQICEGVQALDAKHGRSFDATSQRIAASLLVLARDNDLERVDHVLLSNATADKPAGHTLFVVQGEPGNPAHLRAAMPTELAAQTPVEESMQQFDVVSQEAHQRALANQLEQQMEDQRVQHDIQIRAASGG
ncbi:XVIPCD domain-containing protein [Stenotrophomonas maltophilia]|uniref:XVIPCD domain-containing protein n=1 Tax=Stenotrophomonas maltophilia TaxID=40324 RepID=UPI0039F71120